MNSFSFLTRPRSFAIPPRDNSSNRGTNSSDAEIDHEESTTLYLSARSRPGERPRISLSLTEPPRLAALRRDEPAPPPYDTAFAGSHPASQVPLPDSPELVGRDEQWLEQVEQIQLQRGDDPVDSLAGDRKLRLKQLEHERLLRAGKSWPVRYSVGFYIFFQQFLSFVGWRYNSLRRRPIAPITLHQTPPLPTTDTSPLHYDKDELIDKLSNPVAPTLPTRTSSSFFRSARASLSPSPSLPASPMLSTPPLSAPRIPRLIPKTLVLDLDETLIHSTSRPYPSIGTRGNGLKMRVVEVVLDGRSTVYTVYKRPWVDFFLRKVSTWYTVIIFTASLPEYADPVIDWLDGGDGGGGMVAGRLFRSDCVQTGGAYVKDLSVVDADLSRVCLIDNSPASYAINQANGIPIEGWINDASDECLLDLLPMLDSLRFTSDVRRVLGLRGFAR